MVQDGMRYAALSERLNDVAGACVFHDAVVSI